MTVNGIEKQLDFGLKCAGSFLKGSEKVCTWLVNDKDVAIESGEGILAQGSMLRELHGLLKKRTHTALSADLYEYKTNVVNSYGFTLSLRMSINLTS